MRTISYFLPADSWTAEIPSTATSMLQPNIERILDERRWQTISSSTRRTFGRTAQGTRGCGLEREEDFDLVLDLESVSAVEVEVEVDVVDLPRFDAANNDAIPPFTSFNVKPLLLALPTDGDCTILGAVADPAPAPVKDELPMDNIPRNCASSSYTARNCVCISMIIFCCCETMVSSSDTTDESWFSNAEALEEMEFSLRIGDVLPLFAVVVVMVVGSCVALVVMVVRSFNEDCRFFIFVIVVGALVAVVIIDSGSPSNPKGCAGAKTGVESALVLLNFRVIGTEDDDSAGCSDFLAMVALRRIVSSKSGRSRKNDGCLNSQA